MTSERLEKLRTQLALMSEVGIAGDAEREMIALLAHVDELLRDAEAMATYLVTVHPHTPDCLARKYAKKDDAP